MQLAAVLYRRKYALTRHDAVAHAVKNLAMTVTFLANLTHFQNNLSGTQNAAHRQAFEINTGDENVLAKSANLCLAATRIELIHLVRTQQAHLTVPIACVRIAGKSMIGNQRHRCHRTLFRALRFAQAHRLNNAL